MAGPEGQKHRIKKPTGKLLERSWSQRRYFYIDHDLYRVIRNDRAADLSRCWSYTDGRVVDFVLSDVKRKSQQAFDTSEVAKLLNRTKDNILHHLGQAAMNPPYKIGRQEADESRYEFGNFKWSEDDVLALHAHYLTVGSGRPRKDGMITSAVRIPTRLELIAMMKQNKMYYVQAADGTFVPIFDQPDWT